ncbi:MAG: SpoIIE family protein phosphatase [Spirochaetales bacterium]|nr:SpoIIE family protein phosphatase [Spirochaetales bacterium]
MSKTQIMIVEDEGLVALEIKEALERMGYDVSHVVSSGDDALNKVVTDRPDLILMDIRIQGKKDGIDTAKAIHDDYNVPVVYLTAHSDEKTLERAKLTESYGYILKPFKDQDLKVTIEIALSKAEKEKDIVGSRKQYSLILRSLNEGVIVTDTKGIIKYANETALAILQYMPAEILGKNIIKIFKLLDKETKKSVPIPITKPVIENSIVASLNYLLVNKQGREIQIDCSIAPLKNGNQVTVGIIIVFKNLDDNKRDKEIQLELKRSKEYQLNILPEKGKTINSITCNWLFYPSLFGSGDLFNFLRLDNSHVAFYLLDVMGHGFSAAILSITINNFLSHDIAKLGVLKSYNYQKQPVLLSAPADVIVELNDRFYFKANDNPFFTLIYGVIDTANNKCTVARAGHIYPVLQKNNGDIARIESQGHAVGVFPEIQITEKEFDFATGDRLFLYSDGLIELNRNTREFSESHILDVIQKNRQKSLDELIKNMEILIHEWKQEKQFDDDIAFFALEKE